MSTDEPPTDARPTDDIHDVRVYVIDPELWEARVKQDSERMHCYQQNPGEDFFHLIAKGEVYVVGGTEKLCLRCALRRGVVTQDRLFWQNRVLQRKPPVS
jgi:hypothetical protein